MRKEDEKVSIKVRNQKVKEYLNSVKYYSQDIKEIQLRLTEIKNTKKYPSLSNDGIPHGSSQKDLSNYMAAIDELEETLLQLKYKRVKRYNELIQKLEEMDADEAQAIRLHYLKKMEWCDVAKEMGFSESHIHRIHSKALRNFSIEKL